MTDGASASLPFEQLSKFKNGFEREAMLANDKLLRRDAVKKGSLPPDRLGILIAAVGVKISPEEVEEIKLAVIAEREHALSVAPETVPDAESGPERITFEGFCWGLTHPDFRATLEIEETLTRFRHEGIQEYTRRLLNTDPRVRAAAVKDPPGIIVGDKQAVRSLARELHKPTHSEDMRVDLALAIGAIAEKPREASGEHAKEGQRQVKIYDSKALGALRHTLKLQPTTIYMDTRTFNNREPVDAPVEVENDLIDICRTSESMRNVKFQESIPPERESERAFLHEFRRPAVEQSDMVRTAAVLGFAGCADNDSEVVLKLLLHTAIYDPGWTVRCAALDVLRSWSDDIRKEGPTHRWGMKSRWWPELWSPWRSRDDSLENFWGVMSRVRHDPAWQVRKRAILTMAQAANLGNERVLEIVAAALEDGSSATRQAARKTLALALFGRGSYVSERKHQLLTHVQQGIPHWEAAEIASEITAGRKGGVDADLVVIEVLVKRCFNSSPTTRRAAAAAMGDVMQRAQFRGDTRAMQALLDVVRNDPEVLVQRAAVQSMWKAGIQGEERTLETLFWAATAHPEPQLRKGAVEAIERLTVPGDKAGIECLSACLEDAYAEVREAAVRALERASLEGGEEATAAAEGMLQDSSWFVRRAAARALTMIEPEGERQASVAAKVFGREDKLWYAEVQGYLTKPPLLPYLG
eukprot:CAMPEP_0114141378 /NCGR_PEP_ID=MMETSP0043_2-20121206/17876_1 /TAXON_ID=464988 /ORGANISM="Hemiselmis andersenii, Strain CCMP644" /LENGTH=696 /DNA_ID=CAMNT_0001235515 /DNA_START=230 /DNA_END=2315 /DNA_ORIENTATION=-